MNKLQKTAKILCVCIKVIQTVLIVCAIVANVILAVLTIAELINPATVIGDELNIVEIGFLKIGLTADNVPSDLIILGIGWISTGAALIISTLIYFALSRVRFILEPMIEGDPFNKDTSKYFKHLAWFTLTIGFVGNIMKIVETVSYMNTYKLRELLVGGNVESLSTVLNFDCGFVIVFFVLLLMSYIFDYGAELQQLSDETL